MVTGAPLTDLISMYGELSNESGSWNEEILETSQGRMGTNVTPWNTTNLQSQSQVFNVTKIQTPSIILQGTAEAPWTGSRGSSLQ